MCLCDQVRALANNFNELEAKRLIVHLNVHLRAVRNLYTKSKSFASALRYEVRDKKQRTSKILSLQTVDTTRQEETLQSFQDNPSGFWQRTDDVTHSELGRRLACVVAYLRHQLFKNVQNTSSVSVFAPDAKNADLRGAGKKFIVITRRLGGIGSLFCLPLDIPSST